MRTIILTTIILLEVLIFCTLQIPPTTAFISLTSLLHAKTNERLFSVTTTYFSKSKLTLSVLPSPQKRKKNEFHKQKRHPRNYWSNVNNLKIELIEFWHSINVPITSNESPTIPNESLLNYFHRHDLRYAIYSLGGRDEVSYLLDNSRVIPGKWKDATKCMEVQYLLNNYNIHHHNSSFGILQKDIPPLAPHVLKKLLIKQKRSKDYLSLNLKRFENDKRWLHKSEQRHPKGYWNLDLLLSELYDYLKVYKKEHDRPSIFMPRLSELSYNNRDDIRSAIFRFYGSVTKLCNKTRLIPFNEWNYFENQLSLFKAMQEYINHNQTYDSNCFPVLTDIKEKNPLLFKAIQQYGGKKLLARRLDMHLTTTTTAKSTDSNTKKTRSTINYPTTTTKLQYEDLHYGKFSLDFAIKIMEFIRNNLLQYDPPLLLYKTKKEEDEDLILLPSCIAMPTENMLLFSDRKDLVDEIIVYGGYESVARRLGLYF